MSFSTDPNDAKPKPNGTLNRTLTVNAGLTANFHSSHPPNRAQIEYLADSLAIARRAITAAIDIIDDLKTTTTSKNEMPAAIYDSLVYHYQLPALTDRKNWTAWRPDLEHIYKYLTADRTHLNALVVVGDTYRLVLRPEFAKVKDPGLQTKITGDGTASEGFVNLKKSAWAKLDANPALFDEWVNGRLKFPSTEWGNIKVEFDKLCMAPRLQIAGTLIHETTHKMNNAVDHCYASSPSSYKQLTKAQALDNADSHAFAAICLYKKAFIVNDASLTVLSFGVIDSET